MADREAYVFFNISLDGDRIYGSGGVHLPIDTTSKEIKEAAKIFRKMRAEFQPDLQEALAPTADWFWTDAVVHRLPFADITRLMTVEEARQVPFPIQKEFAGVDTQGKTIGQVVEMDSGLVTWLALDLCQPDLYDKQPPKKKLAIAAARILVKDYGLRRAKKKGDF